MSLAESDIDLKITVDDENDCPPVIKVQQAGQVQESSSAGITGGKPAAFIIFARRVCRTSAFCSLCSFSGTVVMKVIATDADQKGTANSKISYKIASESNPDGMFYINRNTGELMVQQTSLDREASDPANLRFFFLWSSVTITLL